VCLELWISLSAVGICRPSPPHGRGLFEVSSHVFLNFAPVGVRQRECYALCNWDTRVSKSTYVAT